ncbi:hypothetical protein [Tumebacillus flagellatus]|uniref:Uncharacterized protein n=1 Tax=Tumebacillus flagellatus TaxID=1157490 RepID=A0A074LL84_9BACL|nr:hypothetical protein [Tumebacillus flagellatus]KEO81874.1 hypothetical protein EL26_18730 [Tumebacillus flagellatus]
MTKGEKQSFKDFTNQKQLRLSDDPNYQVANLSGDASTDNRQYVTEPIENAEALALTQANSGMFMHPMHDVTQTEQINGDKVLEQLQADLAALDQNYEPDGQHDPNEQQNR